MIMSNTSKLSEIMVVCFETMDGAMRKDVQTRLLQTLSARAVQSPLFGKPGLDGVRPKTQNAT
jgi:hypothetical protein